MPLENINYTLATEPPSTRQLEPTTKLDLSEHRKAITSATSEQFSCCFADARVSSCNDGDPISQFQLHTIVSSQLTQL